MRVKDLIYSLQDYDDNDEVVFVAKDDTTHDIVDICTMVSDERCKEVVGMFGEEIDLWK